MLRRAETQIVSSVVDIPDRQLAMRSQHNVCTAINAVNDSLIAHAI